MKKQFLLFSIIFILINPGLKAQVNVDHPIVLTGNGANAKLTGIQNVTGSQDAMNVQSMQNGGFIYAIANGSNNNFSITISPPVTAYVAGMVFNFISNQTVNGPATLNVNNLGAIPITKYVNQYLAGCEIFTGQFVTVAYDGTNFQMTSVIFPGTSAGVPVATAGTGANATQITANWDSAAHATGYYIDAATDAEFADPVASFTNLYVGDVLSYNITGLNCGNTYYYRVRAANNCGQSNNSNVVSCSTPPFAGVPAAIAGSGATSTQITANWNSAANATGYYLNVATDPGFVNFVPGYNNLNVGNDTTYNVTGLSCGTTYYYQVSAANTCGQSNNSNIISYATGSCCDGAGGTITYYTDGNNVEWTVHTFTGSGTFTPNCPGNVEVLVVAGGGGGGFSGGGGGGGGFIYNATYTVTATPYSVTVGSGGSGGSGSNGSNGGNSVFGTLTALGGGGGGGGGSSGLSGGSGGGGGSCGGCTTSGGAGSGGQGNNGGSNSGYGSNPYPTGGGGGAGAAGQNAPSPTQGGAGGAGLSSNIFGSVVWYAGGGGGEGGGGGGNAGAGGTGGGGAGCNTNGCTGVSGTANTGGGGGGGGQGFGPGGSGGSGVVIISYPNP